MVQYSNLPSMGKMTVCLLDEIAQMVLHVERLQQHHHRNRQRNGKNTRKFAKPPMVPDTAPVRRESTFPVPDSTCSTGGASSNCP
jgi:hypothetical protein